MYKLSKAPGNVRAAYEENLKKIKAGPLLTNDYDVEIMKNIASAAEFEQLEQESCLEKSLAKAQMFQETVFYQKNMTVNRNEGTVPVKSQGMCAICRIQATQRCSICKEVYYCSQKCQKEDWVRHNLTCQQPHTKAVAAAGGAASKNISSHTQSVMILTLPKKDGYSLTPGPMLGNCFRIGGRCANVPLLIDHTNCAQMTVFFEGSKLKTCVWWHFTSDVADSITINWIEQESRPENRIENANRKMAKRFKLILRYFRSVISGDIYIQSACEYNDHNYSTYQPSHKYPENLDPQALEIYVKITEEWLYKLFVRS